MRLVAALLHGDPAVAVGVVDEDAIALNPQTVEVGEEALVLEAVRQALATTTGARSLGASARELADGASASTLIQGHERSADGLRQLAQRGRDDTQAGPLRRPQIW